MKRIVLLAAAIEIPTGLVLIFCPSLFTKLLFGEAMAVAGNALGPLAGFGLLALAIACWPARTGASAAAIRALIAFSFLCALYLAFLGVYAGAAGPLLWPAVAGHAGLGALLLWLVFRDGSAAHAK